MAGLPWIRAYSGIRTDPRSLVLGRLLGNSHAYVHILDLRLWLADNAPSGIIPGPHADIVVEEAVGWRGEAGAFARAAVDSGFLRENPVRDSEGISLEDADWADEQAAHIRKVERDRNKPDGRKKSRATPLRDLSGESREVRVESREEKKLSPAVAVAAPEVDERQAVMPGFEPPPPPPPPEPEQPKERRPSAGEELYAKIQRVRRTLCDEAGESYVDDRWPSARQNKLLGPIAKGSEHDKAVFETAFGEFMADEAHKAKGWPLSLFMHGAVRARYEKQALDALRAAS